MSTSVPIVKTSFAIGASVALVLFVASEVAFGLGAGRIARALEWQASFIQGLVPSPNLGTPDPPIYEGTPLHMVAWYVGAFLGIPLYTLIAYVALRVFRRPSAL